MAKEKEVVENVARKAQGKKAKVKALKTEPKDTASRPLDRKVRSALEEVFSADLKRVRVHTGGNAAAVAKELRAKAFTIGNDIYFAKADDAKKVKALAHELAHVLQQTSGGKPPKAKKGKALTSK